MAPPSRVTIVSGGSYAQREAAVAHAISLHPEAEAKAVILEGLPDGNSVLLPAPSLRVQRIAPGCLCCSGNLVMRVTLNRLLRPAPVRLYLSLSSAEHLEKILQFLQQAPYDLLLHVEQNIQMSTEKTQ